MIGLSRARTKMAVLPGVEPRAHDTIAVFNPSSSGAVVKIDEVNSHGVIRASETRTVAAGGYAELNLRSDLFPDANGNEYVRITSIRTLTSSRCSVSASGQTAGLGVLDTVRAQRR